MNNAVATDALGKPIEIGKVYAYLRNSAGYVTVAIGRIADVYLNRSKVFYWRNNYASDHRILRGKALYG